MKAYERLVNYAKVYTTSDESSGTVPSTDRQWNLARMLCEELKELGVSDAHISDCGYVYGSLPATAGLEDKKALGFIAHMDTATDFSGENVNPQIHENYDGKDVPLGDSGRVIRVSDFPDLKKLVGQTLITADGTTLLGADDKAGIAEIMTMVETILKEGRPHCKLCIGFNPDEEIGMGAHSFDLKDFGADFAYTIDGSAENEIDYETFNAAAAEFVVRGVNVHTGSAKNIMVNAGLVACEINSLLPACDIPRDTEDREGFYHLCSINGDSQQARSVYLIRDHDRGFFAHRKQTMEHIAKIMNEKYGEGTVTLNIRDQYPNMLEVIEKNMFLIENADKAMIDAGLEPKHTIIRGGTDGANLSFMGLPCPNLGTGGYAFHGPMEHITVEAMDKVVNVLLNLVENFS